MAAPAESVATTTLSMSEAINRALREALDGPEPTMLIGQDIGPYGGTFGVTRGLFDDYGEERIRDAPLCESGTVGYAIGLAITGVRAVCDFQVIDESDDWAPLHEKIKAVRRMGGAMRPAA